ncbi:hypothetical protein D3C71_919820 [compost metagenome]
MRKLTLLALFSLLSSVFSFAQNLSIDWGTSFDSSTDVQKILGFSNNKMIVFSSKGKSRFIEEYNEKGFSQLSSTKYELPEISGQSVGLLNITISEGDVLVVLYGYNKKTKSFSLYKQTLRTNGKEKTKLDEFYTSEGDEDKIKDALVDVRFSPDNSKMLVFFDRANKERLKFMSDVILIDLNKLENGVKSTEVEYTMRDAKSESVSFKMTHTVDNDGSYFFISQRTEFTKKIISNFELNVAGYDANGEKIGESEVADKECLLLNPTMIKTDKGYSMVGYYMTNPKKRALVTGYTGLFVAKLDKGINVTEIKKNDFNDDFFKDLYSDRYIRRMKEKNKEIQVPAPYSMDNVVLHADGTMTILSEYFLVTVMEDSKGAKSTMTNYGHIIYYKLSPEGEITAADVVKKNQVSSTQSIGFGIGGAVSMFASFETKDQRKKYWSYSLAVKNDVVYLLFNDHRKNELNEDGEISASLVNPAKGLPYLVEIREDGTFTKKAMAEASDEDTYCVPQITYQLDVDEFIIWGVKRKENKFGKAIIG